MSDRTDLTGLRPETKSKKPRRSEREWIDANGMVIDEEADNHTTQGGRYIFLATGKAVERRFDLNNHTELLMYATFGFHTLMGNVASGKSAEQGYDDCLSRADLIRSGKWVERVGGPRLPYNPENLAKAISIVRHGDDSQAHIYAAKIGPDKPRVTVKDKNGQQFEMDYGAFAYTNPNVQAHHDALQGKVQATLEVL